MAEQSHVTFNVPGINCGHCESSIREAVGALAGVSAVQASNVTKTVDVEFQPGTVSLDAIRLTLDEAGYPAQN